MNEWLGLERLSDAELRPPAVRIAGGRDRIVQANRADRRHQPDAEAVVGGQLECRVLLQALLLVDAVPGIAAVKQQDALEVVVLADRNTQFRLGQSQVAAPEAVRIKPAQRIRAADKVLLKERNVAGRRADQQAGRQDTLGLVEVAGFALARSG